MVFNFIFSFLQHSHPNTLITLVCLCSSPQEGRELKWVPHHRWDPLSDHRRSRSHDRHGAALGGARRRSCVLCWWLSELTHLGGNPLVLFSFMPTICFAKTASVSVATLQHCCLENHCPCTDNASVLSAHERFHFFGLFKNFFFPLVSRHFIAMKFEVICLNPCVCVFMRVVVESADKVQ